MTKGILPMIAMADEAEYPRRYSQQSTICRTTAGQEIFSQKTKFWIQAVTYCAKSGECFV